MARPRLPAIGLAGLLACNLIATLALARLATSTGLHATYFANPAWQGPPALDLVDPELTRGLIERRVRHVGVPFSVEWTGWLTVPVAQTYDLSTLSDDGSQLFLDDALIVENGGVHAARRVEVERWLDAGPHRLRLRFFDVGQQRALYLQWREAAATSAPQSIPPHLLSTSEPGRLAWRVRAHLPAYIRLTLAVWYALAIAIVWIVARAAARRVWPPPDHVGLRLVLAIALVLFVTGIWWGLPDTIAWAPDECLPTEVMEAAAQSFGQGWHSLYPPLYFCVLSVWDTPFAAYEALHLVDRSLVTDLSLMFLAQRLLSVIFAMMLLAIVYALARDLLGPRAAFWAVVIVVGTVPFSYYAKIANVDVPYVTLFALSLVFYVRLWRTRRPLDFYLFTLTGMLAVCIKDQAFAYYLLPAIWMAGRSIWSVWRRAPVPAGVPPWRVLLAMGAIAGATFLLAGNWLLNPTGLRGHLEVVTESSAYYRMFPRTLAGHLDMLGTALLEPGRSMSWPFAIAAVFGVVASLRHGPRELRWLLLMIVSYYLAGIAVVMYFYDRFFLGVFVVLAIAAGGWIARWIDPSRVPARSLLIRRTLVAAACVYALARVVGLDALLLVDARYSAERWLTAKVPANRSMAGVGLPQYLPRQTVVPWDGFGEDLDDLARARPDYLIINVPYARRAATGARAAFYAQLFDGRAGYTRVAAFQATVPFSPLNYESRFAPGMEDPFSNLSKINPSIEVYQRVSR